MNLKKQNISKRIFYLSLIVFGLSLLSQLYVTNKLAIKGKELVAFDYQKQQLKKEISELQLEQSKYSSLKYIETQAKTLGFTENNSYVATIKPTTSTAALPSF